jgi:hypothetical protein
VTLGEMSMKRDEEVSRTLTYVKCSMTDLGLSVEKLSSMYAADTVLCNQVIES